MNGHGGYKNRAVAVLVFFLAGSFVPLGVQSALAEETPALLELSDGAGDVKLAAPDGAANVPADAEPLDIRSAEIYDEHGEAIRLKVTMAKLGVTTQGGPTVVTACFTWRDVVIGVKASWVAVETFVRQGILGVVQGQCTGSTEPVLVPAGNAIANPPPVWLDAQTNTAIFFLSRDSLGDLHEAGPPTAGEALTGFYVKAHDARRTRFDAAPDAGPDSKTAAFALNTANTNVRVAPAPNLGASKFCDALKYPGFAVEAGAKRGVPVVVYNGLGGPRTVQFAASTVGSTDWEPAMLQQLALPEEPGGNLTVNVIIDVPATAAHKACATVRVRAMDAQDPTNFGETTINVIAAAPPTPELKRLYLHTSAAATDAGGSRFDTWLNTLQNDPDDKQGTISFTSRADGDPVAGQFSISRGLVRSALDANPTKDLVLATAAADPVGIAKVNLNMVSSTLPTTAEVEVTLVTNPHAGIPDPIGSLKVPLVLPAGDPQDIVVDVPVAFERQFRAEGDLTRVAEAARGLGILVEYIPKGIDPTLNQPVPGRVTLNAKGTWIELPIVGVIDRDTVRPGESGALFSLAPDGILPEFAAPGLGRLMNFTVLNQGAAGDSAVPSVSILAPGEWTWQVFPAGPYPLAAGEAKSFQVQIVPPAAAKESEQARIEVKVTSATDANAFATYVTKLIVTRSGGVPTEDPLSVDMKKDGGGLPGFGFAAGLLALLGAAVAVAGRRRA